MAVRFIDIHPHIISDDAGKYARVPLFGVQSDWSRDRPVTIEGLIAAMDDAGVDKAAVVQSSTCYGYDNPTWWILSRSTRDASPPWGRST
jgi:L-fuconolactonase